MNQLHSVKSRPGTNGLMMVKQSLDNNLKEVFQPVGGARVKNTLPRGAVEQSPGATSGEQKEHLIGETPEDYDYING